MIAENFFAKKLTIFIIFFRFFHVFCIDVDCDVTDRTDFCLCRSENRREIYRLFKAQNIRKTKDISP